MRSPRLRPWLLSVAALAAAVLALNTSCAQQAEGERCDINNGLSGGDSDCSDPLVCTAAKVLGTDTDRCCPADRSQSTIAPCAISSSSLNQDASAPAKDASSATDSSSGGDTGASTDSGSGSETGSDSGVTDASDSG